MRTLIAAVAALNICFGFSAKADGHVASDLIELMTAYDAQGWEAVGRLNIGRSGMCTGALIAPQLVLTAAHCLYDDHSGGVVSAQTITFLAGWRNGRAVAKRKVRRAIAHPEYEYTGREGQISVPNDVALLELESPIRLSNVAPFQIAPRPRKGATVGVVSYARERAETPALQEVCHVLARQRGTLVLSCDVDFGSSGAPIFAEFDGEPHIVSVVSAMARIQGRQVSLGTSLEQPLADLMVMMKSAPDTSGRRSTLNSGSNAIAVMRGGSAAGGAKFMKP